MSVAITTPQTQTAMRLPVLLLFMLSLTVSTFHASITALEMQDIHAHNEHAQNLLIVTQTGLNLIMLTLILLVSGATRTQLAVFISIMALTSIVTGYFTYWQRYLW